MNDMKNENIERITGYGTHRLGRTKKCGYVISKGYVTNRVFAETITQFKDACTKAGVEPTKRQASKFRRRFGSAYMAVK